ncbi:MAG TPA: 3-hydroxyacyl-CoA dehydrogenase NAD-binding domain-containing protein [Solirubrobacteraceae bacterium]|jgi:3-hydroxybutyryl-CoA dehydrogenase|nr:3-hydroxyacyl-CoA dehydrogenase NAD-binding domain-containing protein [Solirubrobacteraceae bacterium]
MSSSEVGQDLMSGGAGSDRAAAVIGVLGAGTMGSGIAQLAARSGARTLLHDPLPAALQKGLQRARDGLSKEAAKGKLSEGEAKAASARLEAVDEMTALAPCELVIEAVPERIELKHAIYAQLSEIVAEDCVLASNTSSLLVTALGPAASNPERVVGMHFFNPAPLMKLLEVVAGEQSSELALALAHATGEAMGKTVIRASDGPGFLVNRSNRPFGLEALRLLQERIADVETIDRICRMEGGFRMGPFELMDLVGVDVGFEISQSFYAQSFGEPRWRPSPIAARYVAAGLHGRKSGRGYYTYPPKDASGAAAPYRPADPDPREGETPGSGEGVVVISGSGGVAAELRAAAASVGYEVRSPEEKTGGVLPALIVECDREPASAQELAAVASNAIDTHEQSQGGAHLVLCQAGSLGALDPRGSAVGFHVLGPLTQAKLVELTRNESSSPLAAARAERFFAVLGKHVEWVGDAPGLVLGRIVCQVINECAFSFGEGVGDAHDIDTGMVLGLSYPRGPLDWADEIGLDTVIAVLEALCAEYREERYRPAPALRALVQAGRLGRTSGAGFFDYGGAG